jgi:hypothetical protein
MLTNTWIPLKKKKNSIVVTTMIILIVYKNGTKRFNFSPTYLINYISLKIKFAYS